MLYEPGLQFGLAGGWQGTVSARFFSGSADKTGSGNVRLNVLRQFLRDSANAPALALSGQAELPTGQNSEGVDTRLKFILSRTLGGAPSRPRLHLNVGWKHNDKKQPGELGDGYLAILGYSQRLGQDSVLVADLVSEQELTEGQTQNTLELGFIRSVSEQTQLSLGVSAGLSKDSPDYRLVGAFQVSF